MSDPLRITMAQLNTTVGDVEGNAQAILNLWQEYEGQSDLILFPELFLCGYPPEDLVLNTAFLETIERAVKLICEKTKDHNTAALIPTPWKMEGNALPYNAALLIEHGKIKHICTKHKLPNHTVFDEQRTFSSGRLPTPIEFRGHKIGLMICEDMWHKSVPKHLKDNGAEILIAINGSPYHVEQAELRKQTAIKCIENTGLDLIYLNMLGGQDELVFDGQSFIMSNNQEYIYRAPAFEKSIMTFTLSSGAVTMKTTPALAPQNEFELIYNALKLGLKDYVYKNGFKNVLLGMSGGIDSALVSVIAVDALGAENVRCIMLPSQFTAQNSLQDAKDCSGNLGASYSTIEIKDAVKTFESTIPELSDVAHENTQSRIRGVILMALSNMSGELLLTTGNKSEMAVGYCTLYGDMNGAFNPIKDIYKTDVYKLAQWRNTQSPVIPENIISKAPTAELREGQTDQDSLPHYDLLDSILKLLIEYVNETWENPSNELMRLKEVCEEHPETIKKIARLLKNTEYKRYQAAPGTRITSKAFGRDRRYPLTNQFTNRIAKD